MADPSTTDELDHERMWQQLRKMLDRIFSALESEAVLDDCLDIIVDALGADRGLILLTFSDGSSQAINARAEKRTLSSFEREEVSRTIIREASESGRCVVRSAISGSDASSSMNALGIVNALAAPIQLSMATSSARRAILYLDFRRYQAAVGERRIEFFMTAVLLLGAVFQQAERSRIVREQLREAKTCRVESSKTPPLHELLAWPSLKPIREEVDSALSGKSSFLILGESGTGKTLLAQAIAEASGRRPIVRAVLGSSDDLNTITSELFGHERGSYSGATSRRSGLVDYANQGVLILDELLNLPLHAQKLLLDFTQFGAYRPLGYDKQEPKQADVRLIGVTNGDLRSAIQSGRFRLDLFHRLATVTLELPPLRDRREEIPTLVEQILKSLDGARRWTISLPLRRMLLSPAIAWSGNLRQLERAVSRARERALARDPEATELLPEHVESREIDGVEITRAASESAALAPEAPGVLWQALQAARGELDEKEQRVIRRALADAGGVVAQAARELGIARTTLSSRIDALGIRVPRGKPGQR